MVENSVIKKLFQSVEELSHNDNEINEILDKIIESEEILLKEIEENSQVSIALNKFKESVEKLNSCVIYLYFKQAFKMGFILGCEISDCIKVPE
ncbi:MAG: hypothetical protein IJW64_05775 [Clostridia bacterium]|nr:hypothetical protein [Clostridia bacterium]